MKKTIKVRNTKTGIVTEWAYIRETKNMMVLKNDNGTELRFSKIDGLETKYKNLSI